MSSQSHVVFDGFERTFPSGPPPKEFVVGALLELGRILDSKGESRLSPAPESDLLVRSNPFAFFVAVLLDQGVPAERAFGAPTVLQRRLGELSPAFIDANPSDLRAAMSEKPMPHRYPNVAATWIIRAAERIVRDYQGDTAEIWADAPTAVALFDRLISFDGIGQKKAAMAVEILRRDLRVEVREMSGSDVAVDVHIRRVFKRTGLSTGTSIAEIIQVARIEHPSRPGELDVPAWVVGRTWCRPRRPRCETCPLNWACPVSTAVG